MKEQKKIKVLLPALLASKELEKMTEIARKTLVSFEHCIKVTEDNKKYETAVAGVWENFLSKWRGKEYDYLLITTNDGQFDPNCIDYMVRLLEEKKGYVCTAKCTRDLDDFKKNFGQVQYTDRLTVTEKKDPAIIMFKKGVIEDVGEIDQQFPREFVERDYLYRCKLAGYEWLQPDIVLMYHPPYAGTIGNDGRRLQQALWKYMNKWGGDADQERFIYPYNNLTMDYRYVR